MPDIVCISPIDGSPPKSFDLREVP